jgi:cytoplasmic iron level regulating protein YaaA (DUF328/UPF0246 family)
MLILLPPSEGKANPPSAAPPVDLENLVFHDALGELRVRLLDELAGLPAVDREEAVSILGITPGQATEVDRNAELREAPAGPASEVYTGVLYDRLDLPGMSARGAGRAEEDVLIASGLWGMLRPDDRIPNYRLPAKAKLPGVGGLAAFWRPRLDQALGGAGFDESGSIVLDMRSGAYASFWKPRNAELIPVRPFTEVDGVRKAVSHMAKATRGDVARIVLTAGRMPEDAAEIVELLSSEGMEVELTDDGLDVIVRG